MYGFKRRSFKGYQKTSRYRGSAPSYRPYSRGGYGRRYKRGVGLGRRRFLNTRIQRGARSRVVSTYRKKRSSVSYRSSEAGVKRLVARALATRGTWTYTGFTARVGCSTGEQAWLPLTANPWINSASDIVTPILSAITRTMQVPDAVGGSSATVTQQPEFYIQQAKLKVVVVNTSQVDCDLVCYPWRARYDGINPENLYDLATVNAQENKASSTTTQQGLLSGTTSTVGFTPFMSRFITQGAKLGKPKRVHLQGGQSYTFTLRDTKPLHVTYGRWSGAYAFAPHTRGVFMTFRGIPVNDTADTDAIDFGFCALDVQCVMTYEWMAAQSPWKFNDVVTNTADIQNIKIIQPQTGGVTTGPVSV